jgi:hypothetical protein
MNPKTVYNQIQLLYIAILIGLLIFGVAAYYFVAGTGNMMLIDPSTERTVYSILILLVFIGIPVSYIFHKKSSSHINPELSISEKLVRYRKSLFIKLITIEGLAMFSLIGYIVAGTKTYLYIYLILVVVYLISYPGKSTIRQEMQLNDEELNF